MSTFPANEFGGDPFPVRTPRGRGRTSSRGPEKGNPAEEEDDLDDTKTYDLGGGD